MDLRWALLVPAYLVGTFPTAVLVGRREGRDPTKEGSGNPGASNALRTMGRRAGVLVLAGDLGKGMLAAGAGWAAGGQALGVACGLAAVLGHVFPATRRFQGGKGVATAAGVAVVLLPLASLALTALWGLVLAVTRVSAIASLAVAAALPVAAALAGRPAWEVAAFAGCSLLVALRHRENIERLRRGDEPDLRGGSGRTS